MNWWNRLLKFFGWPTPEVIYGCTDPKALNYNPKATQADGSCQYAPVKVYGCTDPMALNYNPLATDNDGTCQYPPPPPVLTPLSSTFWGWNGARSMKSSLKEGKYWYEALLGIWKSEGGPFNVFRNGGTVTMGARFDLSLTGNAYSKSKGVWPAIFSPQRRAEIGTIPDLSEFVSDFELKYDAKEPSNYHVNIKQAQGILGFKILYVANPFQDAAELRAVIQYFGPSNFVGIVAGNEMNSPKAVRFGIKPQDVTYWANTLLPVCQEYGIKLGVGLPPFEYQYKINQGIPLNGKLALDKEFAEHIKDNNFFDFVCIHPYGQLPPKGEFESFEDYAPTVTLANDLDFLGVQVRHFYELCGLPIYLDEHGLEKPEYGHVNSDLAIDWHLQRCVSMLNLSLDFPIMGSCFQLLLADNPGQPQSLVYDDGGFKKSRELQAVIDKFNITGIRKAQGFAVETNLGIREIVNGKLA